MTLSRQKVYGVALNGLSSHELFLHVFHEVFVLTHLSVHRNRFY